MLDPSSTHRAVNRPRLTGTEWTVHVLALAVAYYLTAQIGLLVPSVGSSVCLFWPPAGLALAVLVRGGYRYWPGVLLGAFAANLGPSGAPPAVVIAVGVTLAAVAATWVLNRRGFDREFHSARDLLSIVFAAALGSLVAGAVGTGALALFGSLRQELIGLTVLNWWLGDFGGILIFAPFLLAFSRTELRRSIRRGQLNGILGSFGILAVACVVLYGEIVPTGRWILPATFVLLPIIARTASLYRVWPSSLQVAIVCGCVLWNHYYLRGPGTFLEPTIRIYAAWAFLVTASVVALGISGLLSERDAVERRLKTGEETYRALVHDNPALICRFSTDGHLLFANETFRRAFELPTTGDSSTRSRSDLRNRKSMQNFFDISGANRDARTIAELKTIDTPERPVCFEASPGSGSNAGRWYRWTARAVDMSSSVVIEYHAVGLDVTEQKRAEAERKELEAQAIQAQQFEAIGVLAGGIAHEFNNILTGLIGNADLAMMVLPNASEARPMLGEILRGAQRAAELTKQLSIYAGQTETHPRPHSVPELVRSCERLIDVVASKRCTVRHESSGGELVAVVDETKVRQMLVSLVTNATESMSERGRGRGGEIVVRVTGRSIEAAAAVRDWVNGSAIVPGEYVQLEVVDTGCGMDAITLGRIYEPFFTTKFPGRGLGMSAVLGIVQDHGGAIHVKSEPDRGTTVRVLLPKQGTASHDHPTPMPRTSRRTDRIAITRLVRS